MRAGMAMDQAIDPHQDACTPGEVFQPIDPIAVLVCLFDTRTEIVARELHVPQPWAWR